MAKITFKVPAKARGARKPVIIEKTGTVAYFTIGTERVKFVLQHGPDGKPVRLVHYASGQVFGDLNGPKLEHAVARGTYTRLTDRGAAEALIARAVARMGAAEVLAKLASVPVLNV